MAEHESTPAALDPDTAARLAASVNGHGSVLAADAVPTADAAPAADGTPAGDSPWPDGNGKHKHPREHLNNPGRLGKGAGVNAVHRTSRPAMPHSH